MASRKQTAMDKFKASLTENQQELVRKELLREALHVAEKRVEESGKYKIMGHYSYTAADMDELIEGALAEIFGSEEEDSEEE